MLRISLILLLLGFSQKCLSQDYVSTAFVVIFKDKYADIDLKLNTYGFGHMGSKIGYKTQTGIENFDKIGTLGKPHKIAHATYYFPYYYNNTQQIEQQLKDTGLFSAIYNTVSRYGGRYANNAPWCVIKKPVNIIFKNQKKEGYRISPDEIKEYLKDKISTSRNENEIAFLWYKLGKLLTEENWFERKPDYLEVAHCYMSAKNTKGEISPFAAFELGRMYELGEGLPQSNYLAEYYYKIGAEKGFGPCLEKIKLIANVFPDMKEKNTFIEMRYPKLVPNKMVVSRDCAGNSTERISYKFEGNFDAQLVEDYALNSSFKIYYSPIYFSVIPDSYYPSRYGIKSFCITETNELIKEQYLIHPQQSGDKISKISSPSAPVFETYIEPIEQVFPQHTEGIKPAQYPEGESNFMEMFYKYFRKSALASQKNVSGEVLISFTVEANGALSDFRIEEEPISGVGDEIIRVISHLGKWKPAKLDGKAVRYSLEKSFQVK